VGEASYRSHRDVTDAVGFNAAHRMRAAVFAPAVGGGNQIERGL